MTRRQLRTILSMPTLTSSERLVLILLMLSKGEASTTSLMGKLAFHRRTSQRCTTSLQKAGLIERTETNTNAIYRISRKLEGMLK